MNSTQAQKKYKQLIEDGFCVLNNILDSSMLQRVDEAVHRVLASEEAEHFEAQRSTGSLIPVHKDPVFAKLVTWPKAIRALKSLGFDRPVFSTGYVISKPQNSPPLFWHQDWWGWNDPVSYQKFPQQIFLMYYLVDTRPENGCLRLIPGSHLQRHTLHDETPEAHAEKLAKVSDPSHPAFQHAEGEVDVCVEAGDVVIGDSRILHSSHANSTNHRRTVVTIWYLPLFHELPESMQSFLAHRELRDGWSKGARKDLQPFDPIYNGPTQETEWNRTPGPALR